MVFLKQKSLRRLKIQIQEKKNTLNQMRNYIYIESNNSKK